MKAGDLAYVVNCATGDPSFAAELWRSRMPVLIIRPNVGTRNTTKHCSILVDGEKRYIRKTSLRVISENQNRN